MSMKALFLITFLLISPAGYTQNVLTINELIKLLDMSDDRLDTYLTARGFFFNKSTEDEFRQACKSYDREGKKFSNEWRFRKCNVYNSDNTTVHSKRVEYSTKRTKEYLALKGELNRLGFKYIESFTSTGGLSLAYKKGKISVVLMPSMDNGSEGEKTDSPDYFVSISKLTD